MASLDLALVSCSDTLGRPLASLEAEVQLRRPASTRGDQ
jgi:hypothetical protein